MKRVDFHIHTTVSDGTLSPFEVVAEASKAGIAAIGITDHDTMQGVHYAESAGKKHGVEIIPGVEISSSYNGREIHILGYYCDPNNPLLRKKLKSIRIDRYNRMVAMVQKLKMFGINIRVTDVLKEMKGQMLGRPHLAMALMRKGYCRTPVEAFKKYIGENRPAYVERFNFTPYDAIILIRNARGIPVIAHPGLYHRDSLIPSLVSAGLLGIEVYHPDHGFMFHLRYFKIARKYNLLITGGSDYHGIALGSSVAIGGITVDYSHLEKMRQVHKAIKKDFKIF